MSNNAVLLVARILLAIIFVIAGAMKFADLGGTAAYIGSVGLPLPAVLAPLSGAFEVLGGLAILLGIQTRAVAYLLALFCVVTGALFHFDPANPMQFTMFLKNLAIAGGFIALANIGAGEYSVDQKRGLTFATQS
jgi:putative oxidoreductase